MSNWYMKVKQRNKATGWAMFPAKMRIKYVELFASTSAMHGSACMSFMLMKIGYSRSSKLCRQRLE